MTRVQSVSWTPKGIEGRQVYEYAVFRTLNYQTEVDENNIPRIPYGTTDQNSIYNRFENLKR